jgi:uncharacterized protein (DUF697 family)
MNAARLLLQIRNALGNLNPNEVRELARKPVVIEISASNPRTHEEMENYFALAQRAPQTGQTPNVIDVAPPVIIPGATVLRIVEEGMPQPAGSFVYRRNKPEAVVCEIIEKHPDLKLALARRYSAFRKPVAEDVIFNVSKENAFFSVATSVPALMPLLAAPWAIGEFASDTAFLTMNQIRMAFMLAAAHDEVVGYKEQKSEIASMFAGAFGWRAIARELIGVIPMGGGIIPKAGIAFAGTYVVGLSLEKFYRMGQGMTPEQRKQAYRDALERGKSIATDLLNTYKGQRAG